MAELEAERDMSRAEVAEYLHLFADKLDTGDSEQSTGAYGTTDRQVERDEVRGGEETAASGDTESQGQTEYQSDTAVTERSSAGKMTFMVGNESTTINPPDTVTFEVTVDSESSLIGSETGRTARFALHWDDADVAEDEELSIQ